MDFESEVPWVNVFPVGCPDLQPRKMERSACYLMAKSMFETQVPGQDMIDHADYFYKTQLPKIIEAGNLEATVITGTQNRRIKVVFSRCYVSPPFSTTTTNAHAPMTLEECREDRTPYKMGVWSDLELRTQTFQAVKPLSKCTSWPEPNVLTSFFAPCLGVPTLDDPQTGFVCSRKTSCTSREVFDSRLDLDFAPGVWDAFHEDCTARQNANSANLVDMPTFKHTLWACSTQNKNDAELWSIYQAWLGDQPTHQDDEAQPCLTSPSKRKRTPTTTQDCQPSTNTRNHQQNQPCPKKRKQNAQETQDMKKRKPDNNNDNEATNNNDNEATNNNNDNEATNNNNNNNNNEATNNNNNNNNEATNNNNNNNKQSKQSKPSGDKPPKSPPRYLLVKNLVFIGYKLGDKFRVVKMGKRSILTGKVVHTRPPYIEQCEELLLSSTVLPVKNVLVMQFPCVVGTSLCHTSRETCMPRRYDGSIMHFGTTERVVTRSIDVAPQLCHVRKLDAETFEATMRCSHTVRNAYRSTSSTTVILSPQKACVVLPFLQLVSDQMLHIDLVYLVKLLVDQPTGPSLVASLDDFLDILLAKLEYFVEPSAAQKMRAYLVRHYEARQDTTKLLATTRQEAMLLLGELGSRHTARSRQVMAISTSLDVECMPHLGLPNTTEGRRAKMVHIAQNIVWPCLKVATKLERPTSVFSLRSRSITGFGDNMCVMVRQALQRFLKMSQNNLAKKAKGNVAIDASVVHDMFDHQRKFENMCMHPFNSGQVQPTRKTKGQRGKIEKKPQPVIETLLPANLDAKLSIIQRVRVGSNRNNYVHTQRMVDLASAYFVDAAQVSEGPNCGLALNLCIGVTTSIGKTPFEDLARIVFAYSANTNSTIFATRQEAIDFFSNFSLAQVGTFGSNSSGNAANISLSSLCSNSSGNAANNFSGNSSVQWSMVYVNSTLVGIVEAKSARLFTKCMREARTAGAMPADTSVFVRNSDVHVDGTQGRPLRLLVRADLVRSGVFAKTFKECIATNLPLLPVLVRHHLVERYSPWEIEDALDPIVSAPDVASFNAEPEKYTHLEVDAAFMFSNMVVSSTNQSHNQCVRTSYATKHRTQAAGTMLYPRTQPENNRVSLDYPMTPLVDSAYNHMAEETFSIRATQVVVMAVMSDARASDDGIIINKASIERGLFNITRVQDYHAQAKANHTICVPGLQVKGRKASDYSKLGPDGVVKLGSLVVFNDVLIGIVFHDTKTDTMVDKSVIYPKVGTCKVVNVQHATNKYGVDSVSVTLQQVYNSQVKVGDKLASTHSQKGVVVAIVCASDMPLVAEGPNMGMSVDIIFNPQGLPTRMTPGAVEEGAMGLYAAKFGKRVNATVFESKPDLSREEFVEQFGDAKVAMMNPATGQLYPSKVAVLLSSYYRLDQLASEKLQVRDGGPKDPYNQPKAGKANNGGLRVGLMEGAAFGGHGATEALCERHVLMSDAGTQFVCSNTECSNVNGDPLVGNADSGLCRLCNTFTCKRVDMPYTTACLINHLESAGIHWSLKLEEVDQQGLKGAWADTSLGSQRPRETHRRTFHRKSFDQRTPNSKHSNPAKQAPCSKLSWPYYKNMAGPFSGPSVRIERPSNTRPHRQPDQAPKAGPRNVEGWTSSDDSEDDLL